MKRLFAKNGYTVYQATARDEKKYPGIYENQYYIYFSSDIRDFGIGNSYFEFECVTPEEVNDVIESCGNYAIAREMCEEYTTCVSEEDITTMQNILSATDDKEEAMKAYEELDEDEGKAVNIILLDIPFKDSTTPGHDKFEACIFDFLSTYNGQSGYKVIARGLSDTSEAYYNHIGTFALTDFKDTNVHALIIEDAGTENVIDMYYFKRGGTLAHRPQI